MSAEKLYSEIIEEFEKKDNKTDRIAILKKYDSPKWREFLQYAMDPNIKFDVPIPKYRPAEEPAGLNFTYLDSEVPKMYRFIAGHPKRPTGLNPQKQQSLLVVILESLHKDEAELLVNVLQKKFKVNNLTIKLVKEAYPGM